MKDMIQLTRSWIDVLDLGTPISKEAAAILKLEALKIRGTRIQCSKGKKFFDVYMDDMYRIIDIHLDKIDLDNYIQGLEEMEDFLSSIGL